MTASGRMLKLPVLSGRPLGDGYVVRTDDAANDEYWHEVVLTRADLETALACINAARDPRDYLRGIVDVSESDNAAQPLTCANCGEASTNPGQFVKDGRWVCSAACRNGIVDAP